MAQNQATVALSEDTWTQITNADATAITFQVLCGEAFIRFTADTTTPTEANGIRYCEGQGELQKNISDLTNLASADRVWAKACSGGVKTAIYVDHA